MPLRCYDHDGLEKYSSRLDDLEDWTVVHASAVKASAKLVIFVTRSTHEKAVEDEC